MKNKAENRKKAGRLYNVLIVLLAAVVVYSGYRALREYRILRVASDTYSLVASEYAETTGETVSAGGSRSGSSQTAGEGVSLPLLNIDFEGLLAENPDTVAWLYCDDSVINYPVVQTTDNEYYLKHLFSGEFNALGTLFVDAENSSGFTDDNTVIYGHYLKNGQMFRTLSNYDNQEYYEDHPIMLLYTPDCVYLVEIFASAILDGTGGLPLNFAYEEDREEWIDSLYAASDIRCGVEVEAGDRILTLYTCAYTFENARRMVFGKLVPLS